MKMGAVFSKDRRYRYALTRDWAVTKDAPAFVVIGLNPSTADETQDDPTIRRCIGFAKREGFQRLLMLNLFAFRATDPKAMMQADDPVGPRNDAMLTSACVKHNFVVAAWGTKGGYRGRDADVCIMLDQRIYCLGRTKDQYPKHPLYLPSDAQLVPYIR